MEAASPRLKTSTQDAQKAAAEKQAQEQERQATVSQKQDEEKGMLEAQSLIMLSVIPFSSLTRSSMMTTLLL